MRSFSGSVGNKDVVTTPSPTASPRICMPTWRRFTKRAFRCGLYEAQDVLVDIDDVDLIELEMTWAAGVKEAWLRFPLYHDITRKFIYANPGLKRVRLNRDYDVFIAVCAGYWDLPYINAIERWRDHCKVSICWIDEMWAAAIPGYKYWLDALSQFDFVFMGFRGSISTMQRSANRSCYWLPGGIDALRFSPWPSPPERVIDVYGIGRRHEAIHRKLLESSARGDIFYVHDTLAAANTEVYDPREHRNLFASLAKRSRYFLVSAAKMNAPIETQGQVEPGYRYFEGAAAGAVMIGDVPNCDAYRQLFDWPEAVIQIQPDGSDLASLIKSIDPERAAEIGKRNSREALLRHDWAYRWKEMFRLAGLDPSPRLAIREQSLKSTAAHASDFREKLQQPDLAPAAHA